MTTVWPAKLKDLFFAASPWLAVGMVALWLLFVLIDARALLTAYLKP